ncbi:MAG: C10 family peptidase [Bacteroidales bacterium]|nr:C10 family peptidase [Bacteroidales bacterium]
MRKFTPMLALLLMAALPTMAERVKPETARKVASTFLNSNGAKAEVQLADLSRMAGFANLYIFTTEPAGFVVMAADDRVQPILGYSFNSSFGITDMPDNLRSWLQGYNDQIQHAIDNQAPATAQTKRQWIELAEGNTKAATATPVVAPLLQTKWGQEYPFNGQCPSGAVSGCVATAMAQIMKYWEWPASGTGTHTNENNSSQTVDFSAATYDYDNMANLYYNYYDDNGTPHQISDNPTQAQIDAVATLMYHCGVAVDMEYGSGSYADTYYIGNRLQTYFNFPNISTDYLNHYGEDSWTALLKTELDANRPMIYYGGYSWNGGRHVFVCDGYDSDDKFHFNWGWNGHYDGYFSLGNLNTGANSEAGSGNGDYTAGQNAFYGIQPNATLPNTPGNFAATAEGQTVAISWDAVSDATSYKLYRNGVAIATLTTETNYTDEEVAYGEHIYSVRSVANDGSRSLAANAKVEIENSGPVVPVASGPVVTDLQADIEGQDVTLSWTALTPGEDVVLKYGENRYNSSTVKYWGQRFPASTDLAGKAVSKISTCIGKEGNYEVMVCKGMGNRVTQTVYTQSFTIEVSDRNKWIEIVFEEPVLVDYTTDLWIVIHSESGGETSVDCALYTDEGHDNAALYADNLDGNFQQRTTWAPGTGTTSLSFLIRTTLTEGTYSYNVYKDDVKIAQDLTDTIYGATLEANKPNVFTVTTNYYGGESSASNSVGHALGEATIESVALFDDDILTIAEGSTLIVSGTLTNDNPDNLVIEDGGQLFHSSEGVKATVKKEVAAYTPNSSDGWHLIGYPFAENGMVDDMANLTANEYDLYYYDEPTHYWKNQKHTANNFTELTAAKGYLYANSGPVSLGLKGTLNAGNATVSLPLDYTAKAGRLKGFNLVGNPFAHNVTSFTGTNVATKVYRMNETKDGLIVSTIDEDNPLMPGEGFFVKATANGASITFNGGAKGSERSLSQSKGSINLELRENGKLIDRLIVKQDGEPLEKLSLKENSTKLFALRDNQEMAVVVIEDNEQPINFKAAKNGEYTLSFNLDGVNLDYLHLIDNMTGADVDLLQTNKYTFTAKTTDYASRFRLVFSSICEDANGDNEAFAYINNGNIIITTDAHGAADTFNVSLQVIDIMGRGIVFVGGHTRCVPTAGMPAGVYVLRLMNGDTVRTQKIVID